MWIVEGRGGLVMFVGGSVRVWAALCFVVYVCVCLWGNIRGYNIYVLRIVE